MKLILPAQLRARIESEARRAFPNECCGLLEGVHEADATRAVALHSGRNIAPRPDRFEIAPEDHFAALKIARANGHALIGCYHSHPGGQPVPSATDRAGAGEEGFFWLIASFIGPSAPVTLAAFVYSAAGFLSVDMADVLGADLVTSSGKERR
jgi:proteasome lid subunit RPN8/RPN11